MVMNQNNQIMKEIRKNNFNSSKISQNDSFNEKKGYPSICTILKDFPSFISNKNYSELNNILQELKKEKESLSILRNESPSISLRHTIELLDDTIYKIEESSLQIFENKFTIKETDKDFSNSPTELKYIDGSQIEFSNQNIDKTLITQQNSHFTPQKDSNTKAVQSLINNLYFTGSDGKPCVKIYVPVEEYPNYNFIGRILGPRGNSLKRMEQETGTKIMIRGKGSMPKQKEIERRGKPGADHLNEPLHVLVEVDYQSPYFKSNAEIYSKFDKSQKHPLLMKAEQQILTLLIPVEDSVDQIKKDQLNELKKIKDNDRLKQNTSSNNITNNNNNSTNLSSPSSPEQQNNPKLVSNNSLGSTMAGMKTLNINSQYNQAGLPFLTNETINPNNIPTPTNFFTSFPVTDHPHHMYPQPFFGNSFLNANTQNNQQQFINGDPSAFVYNGDNYTSTTNGTPKPIKTSTPPPTPTNFSGLSTSGEISKDESTEHKNVEFLSQEHNSFNQSNIYPPFNQNMFYPNR